MDINWTVIGTLGGTIVGALSTYFVNKQKLDWDSEQTLRKRNWDQEDIANKEYKENFEKKFDVYNKVMKAHIEEVVVTHRGELRDFDLKVYVMKIRPIIYESFHKIDNDVRILVRQMDSEIDKMNYLEDSEPEWLDYLGQLYSHLIDFIEEKYKQMIDVSIELNKQK
ncbi:hypothetical protein [Paenibacillus elgii]|uniref:hypothetical protein n=1 Tax=Paenibacillus elgii TaxID=189691 RepID=UPI000248C6BE|nr:hypothetical protein [Paenibacillus elgii]